MAVARPVFQAQWNATNQHLKLPEQTCIRRIAKAAWNILSVAIPIIGLIRLIGYGIGLLANRMILPAARFSEDQKEEARETHRRMWHNPAPPGPYDLAAHYTAEEYTVKTPDGAELQATYYRSRNADALTPTVICCQPNGTVKDQNIFVPLIAQSADLGRPLNMLTFDYRGVGDSTGKFERAEDLVVDGTSMVDFVHRHLGVPKQLIDIYGFSLGGVQAVKTQALDPELRGNRNANDRSLASIKAMVYAHTRAMNRFKWAAPFIAFAAKAQGYEMEVLSSYKKLHGPKLVIYHMDDPVIPFDASTKKHLGGIPHESLQLETPPEFLGANAHCIPLYNLREAGTGRSALRVAAEFFVR